MKQFMISHMSQTHTLQLQCTQKDFVDFSNFEVEDGNNITHFQL